jgi:undecaprenyl-diphosphatase
MDKSLEYLINRQWTNPFLDRVMAIFTNFDVWIPILIFLIVIMLWRGRFRTRSFVIVTLLTIALTDGIFTQFTKKLINRPRPPQSISGVREVSLQKAHPAIAGIANPIRAVVETEPTRGLPGRSFPSGHAVNNSLIATIAILFFGRKGAFYIIPAALVSYSRIYCGSHWPSDVGLSILFGIGFGLALPRIFHWLYRKFCPSLFPTLFSKQPTLVPAFTQ